MNPSLYAQFKKVVDVLPRNIALRFEKRKWGYEEVDRAIEKTALRLANFGIKPRDVITVALPNCPEAIFLFYAINRLGAISYNVHPLTPPEGLRSMMEFAESKVLIALNINASKDRMNLSPGISIISVNPYSDANLGKRLYLEMTAKKGPGILPLRKIKPAKSMQNPVIFPEDDAVYLNTGGTGGEPKVVRLSNRAINHVAANSYQLIGGPYENIRILTAIPLFHIFGLEMGLHTPLSFGGTSVLMLRFHTKEAIEHMKTGRATVLLGVPSLYNALLSRDAFYGRHLKKQVTAFIGGDNVPASLLDRWNQAMIHNGSSARLYEGYGLTEAGVTIVSTKGRSRRGSIGVPLPGIKVKILDPETHKEVPNGTSGEIALGGPSLMSGYLKDPKRDEEDFLEIDGERYFLTKDYGYADKDGYDYFKQRLRRVVKINGETLCPSDLEDAVMGLEDVFDAYAYGIKDERKGASLALLLVKRDGDRPKTEEEVLSLVKERIASRLAPALMPKAIHFLPRLPRTAMGKIDEKALRKEHPSFFMGDQ